MLVPPGCSLRSSPLSSLLSPVSSLRLLLLDAHVQMNLGKLPSEEPGTRAHTWFPVHGCRSRQIGGHGKMRGFWKGEQRGRGVAAANLEFLCG